MFKEFKNICTLEVSDPNLDKPKLDPLNEEDRREIMKLLRQYNKLLFKEGGIY